MGRVEQHRGELYRVGARRTRLVYGGIKATEGQAQSVQGARRSRTSRAVAGSMRVRSGKRGRGAARRDPTQRRTENPGRVWVKEWRRRATRGVRRRVAGYRKRGGRHSFEYGLRRARGTRGLRVRVMANDRITRYLGIEIQSLCMYVLAAYRRGSAYSTEAGLKYFVRGAMASARRRLGGARVYGATGTRSRRERERRRRAPATAAVDPTRRRGYGRIRRGLRFKRGSAPRHNWVPDVYEGAPRGSTAYFAVVPKRAVRVAWRRRVYLPRNTRERGGLTRRGARSSLAVGSRRGLHQRRVKRFLAYSSIAHVGYMRCGTRVGSREGVAAVLAYGRIYRVMSRAVWARRRVVEHGSADRGPVGGRVEGTGREVKYRTDRGGRGEVNRASARARVRVSFSMAGVPPLAGFVSKLRVFRARVEGGEYRVTVIAVRRSVVGCFNYLRRIKLVQFDRVGREGRERTWDRGASRIGSASLRFRRARMWYPGPRRRRTHRMARARVG